MRVLVVPSWYPDADTPFNGSFFREQAHMLIDAGHEVSVLAPTMVPAQHWRGSAPRIEDDGRLRVVRFAVPALPRGAQGPETRLLGRLAGEAIRAGDLQRPNVIHAHSVMPAALVAQELSLASGVPYLITEHRPVSLSVAHARRRAAAVSQSVKDAAVMATVSTPFARAIEDHYGIGSVEVIDLPVPSAFFATVWNARPEAPYTFLHVSHLDDNKRPVQTIEAFAAAAAGRDARLVIAGGLPERVAELRAAAERLDVADRVELLGRVSREDMPQLMADADCLVLGSAREAGGTVLSEARASGMALIATATWAGRHGVDPDHGALVDIDDPDQLGAAMGNAIDGGWAAEARERGEIRERARARYSPEAFTARQVSLYEQACEVTARPAMLFHAPYPMDMHPSSASRLRPTRMLEAFDRLGVDVHQITGTPAERARGLATARRRRGTPWQFLYSENSTQPNLFAMSVKTGLAPLLEARIFAWARRSGIPQGEFYRDIYWRHSTSLRSLRSPRSVAMAAAYRADLAVLRAMGVHLFLPSEAMGPELPYPEGRFSALPPGCEVVESPIPSGVHLFYVGGMGSDYGLHACVEAVSRTEDVTLTLCVPERDFARHRDEYEASLSDRIRVVHARSDELEAHYDAASACVLFVEPTPYRRFAAPVKLFEYLGHGKPILLSRGTLAAEWATAWGVGADCAYDVDAFSALLAELVEEPGRLQAMAQAARRERLRQTWGARARTVVEQLSPATARQLRRD